MSEDDDLIRELEKLSAASASAANVDSAVENKINYEGRRLLLTGLNLIEDKLGKDFALNNLVPIDKLLVRSHPSIIRPHKIIQEVEPSNARLTLPFQIRGAEALGLVDSKFDRTLIFDEFSSRFEILVKKVAEGKFDDLLAIPPEVVIHGIMGLSGELIDRLGIDPKKGETWAMLEKEMKPSGIVASKPMDLATPAKKITEAIIEFSKNLAKRSSPETAADTQKRSMKARESDKQLVTPRYLPADDPEIPEAIPVNSDIGMVVVSMDDQIALMMGLKKERRGVLVIGVQKNSIAEKAGIKTGTIPFTFRGTRGKLGGDVIIGVEDKSIENVEDFKDYINHYHKLGTQIKLRLLRDLKLIEISLTY